MPFLLKVSEVARLMRVGDQTVRNYCETGRLPAVRLGRVWRINRLALERIMGVELDQNHPVSDSAVNAAGAAGE